MEPVGIQRRHRGDSPPSRRWSFGAAVLDEATLELRINGLHVHLERKPLQTLMHLLHHAGEVVTKDEIQEAVWPGRFLSESVLTNCISRLREALGDDRQAIIKTVHGYGYRLVAPISIETHGETPAPRFDFRPGDHPPLRPLWDLSARLGAGGHGEVWLAHHSKTREARVYKFALDGGALASLKREITLFRLLRETLPDRDDFVRILDWNLEAPPYFIECEHTAGGSLVAWAEAQGGLAHVPLGARLELLAKVADALAAAHSVGVLHKDLKPANVLIERDADSPRVRLGDFGSGAVVDLEKLEALGITRLGFTQSVKAQDTSGTFLYLAPEVIGGQPSTVQADVYALGVMLFQLVVGDFKRHLAPGWEHDVDDELLREDIAHAAEGYAPRRLADAAVFAERLRALEQRRATRAQLREEAVSAERALAMRRELRRWRVAAGALLVLAGVAVTAGAIAYRARADSEASARTANAVSDFLTHDVFPSDVKEGGRPADISLKEILDRAGERVDQRLAEQPAAAAKVHTALGASYHWLGDTESARKQSLKALTSSEKSYGRAARQTWNVLLSLAGYDESMGNERQALQYVNEVLGYADQQEGRLSTSSIFVRLRQVELLFGTGEVQRAETTARDVFADAARLQDPPAWLTRAVRATTADMALVAGDYARAEGLLRQDLEDAAKDFGEDNIATAEPRIMLGLVLALNGRYPEAEALIAAGRKQTLQWSDADNPILLPLFRSEATLRLEQGQAQKAATLLEGSLKVARKAGAAEQKEMGLGATLLAESYQRLGRLREAEATMREALAVTQRYHCMIHVLRVYPYAVMADILREEKKDQEAWNVLDSIPAGSLVELGDTHPHLADFRRVEGLLWLAGGQREKAKAALEEAFHIYQLRYGPNHWRTARALRELSRVVRG